MDVCKTGKKRTAGGLSLLKEDRPLVYVASPFSGDVERNVMNARRYCRFAAESGAVPLAPHLLLPQFLQHPFQQLPLQLPQFLRLPKRRIIPVL